MREVTRVMRGNLIGTVMEEKNRFYAQVTWGKGETLQKDEKGTEDQDEAEVRLGDLMEKASKELKSPKSLVRRF